MQFLKTMLFLGYMLLSNLGEQAQGLNIGDKAVDFNLKNIDGKMISLASNQLAQGYILVFTCNTCPYAVLYEDRIIALHNKYAALGYPVLAVQPNNVGKSPGDSFENMQRRAQEKSFEFPYVIDENQEITKAYGATNTPQVFVMRKVANNNLRIEYIGSIDNNSQNATAASKHYVEEAVDNLLKGNSIPIISTKAIGCTIKW